jgi:YD repeat-containing protein
MLTKLCRSKHRQGHILRARWHSEGALRARLIAQAHRRGAQSAALSTQQPG